MKLMKLILVAMLIVMMMPVALSQGSYLSPYIGQMYPTDWLEGGYVSSFDRSMLMDPGIAGMVRWLDSPVPSFSWYSSDVSFYRQMLPASTFSPFSEYYATAAVPIEGEIVSYPVRFDITQATPSYVYYGAGQGLPYSQYLSIVPSKTNDLWIRGTRNWTQYLVSPVGMTLELVANVPVGGMGSFYETVQTETSSQRSKTYQFNAGYNTMKFNTNQLGRHILYFVVGNQPSNVVIVDVFAQAPQAQPFTYPVTDSANAQQYLSPSQKPAPAPSSGDVPVTIIYPNPGNFEVYVDGAYAGTGTNGDFTFKARGGMSHVISIWDGFWMYQKSIYFESGLAKVINVEAI
jgi:hypothetical protein